MKDWVIGGGVILALIVAVGFACFQWGAAEERAKIAAAPRDTTVKWRIDTVKVPEIHVKTITVTHIDTLWHEHPLPSTWYKAEADTTIGGLHYEIAYLSPVPLSPEGFFSDLIVQLPPRIDSVRTVYVTQTFTVVEERIVWPWVVGAFGVGAAAAAILVKAN